MSKNISYRDIRFSKLRMFSRNDDGVAAIEFAMLAIPFFYILMAVLETSLIFFAETNLEVSVENAAREIRVGSFTAGTPTEQMDAFVDSVCSRAIMVPDCENTLKVDVRTMTQFSQAAGLGSIDACLDGANPADFGVTQGMSNSLMLIRVCFRWKLATPFMASVFSYPAGSGARTLSTVMTFRNEPYNGTNTIGAGVGS